MPSMPLHRLTALGVGTALGLAALAIPAQAATAHPKPKVIKVSGAANFRDVGGYSVGHGKHVRYGMVFRSASLAKLTAAGQAKLTKLHIKKVFDFRQPNEINIPIIGGVDKVPAGISDIAVPINGGVPFNPIQIAALKSSAQSTALMVKAYRSYVHNAASRKELGVVLRQIAGTKKPVLYHCTAGKDRTGTETAILLTLLGVNKKQVFKDYLASNRLLAATNKKESAELRLLGIKPQVSAPLLGVKAAYLKAAFAQIRKDYGSFAAFLTKGLHVSKATQAKLRKRLTT